MKHLKLFEDESIELKKYIVCSSFKGVYFILKIDDYVKNKLIEVLRFTYLYNFYSMGELGKLEYINEKGELSGVSADRIIELMVFQSDDLQECLDVIPILNNTNKYNL